LPRRTTTLRQSDHNVVLDVFHSAAHTAVVTSAIFAPCPDVIIRSQSNFLINDDAGDDETSAAGTMPGEVLVSADYSGAIRVFINKFKPMPD
jgi:hypothetical protein